jgi:hypothetical protein
VKLGEGGKEVAVLYSFVQGQSEWRKDITIVVMGLRKIGGEEKFNDLTFLSMKSV